MWRADAYRQHHPVPVLVLAVLVRDAVVMRIGDFVPSVFSFRDPDGNRLQIVERG